MSELEKSVTSAQAQLKDQSSNERQFVNAGAPIKVDRPRDPETGRFIVFDNEQEKYVKTLEYKVALMENDLKIYEESDKLLADEVAHNERLIKERDSLNSKIGNLREDLHATIDLADNLSIEKRDLETKLKSEESRTEELFNKWLALDMRVGDLRMGLSVVIATSIAIIAFLTMLVVRK